MEVAEKNQNGTSSKPVSSLNGEMFSHFQLYEVDWNSVEFRQNSMRVIAQSLTRRRRNTNSKVKRKVLSVPS